MAVEVQCSYCQESGTESKIVCLKAPHLPYLHPDLKHDTYRFLPRKGAQMRGVWGTYPGYYYRQGRQESNGTYKSQPEDGMEGNMKDKNEKSLTGLQLNSKDHFLSWAWDFCPVPKVIAKSNPVLTYLFILMHLTYFWKSCPKTVAWKTCLDQADVFYQLIYVFGKLPSS